MASKSRRFDTRTILIILLVITIIGAGYIIITNLPAEIDFVTPDEIVKNKEGYLNQQVIVKGYYDKDPGDFPIIVSTMSTTTGRAELKLDYGKIVNATDDLRAGTLYYFEGTIVWEDPENPFNVDIILIADEFTEV